MSARTVSSTLTEMSELMLPNDANFLGKVFGGRLLALLDLCAYTTAVRFSGEICVTASFDRVDFREPIELGEVIILSGMVSYVGRTSIEVTIEVHAENIQTRTTRHTNTARVTMVAIRDGKPAQVPRLICETRADKIRFLQGRLRRELRQKSRVEQDRLVHTFDLATDEELDGLLAQETLS